MRHGVGVGVGVGVGHALTHVRATVTAFWHGRTTVFLIKQVAPPKLARTVP